MRLLQNENRLLRVLEAPGDFNIVISDCCRSMFPERPTVPDQGCAGPVAYVDRGAQSPPTCDICPATGARETVGATEEGRIAVLAELLFPLIVIFVKP